ncbi:hypothetical protein EON79_23155, partial [bacterium]
MPGEHRGARIPATRQGCHGAPQPAPNDPGGLQHLPAAQGRAHRGHGPGLLGHRRLILLSAELPGGELPGGAHLGAEALREVLARDVVAGAIRLLGCVIVWPGGRARIVETKAYRGLDDPGCHAFGRQRMSNMA